MYINSHVEGPCKDCLILTSCGDICNKIKFLEIKLNTYTCPFCNSTMGMIVYEEDYKPNKRGCLTCNYQIKKDQVLQLKLRVRKKI